MFGWATRVRRKAVSSLTREDVLAYESFLAAPIPEVLLDDGEAIRALSACSQRYAMGVVGSLFTYLVNAGYLACNPWTARRRKLAPRVRQVERHAAPARSARAPHYERARWVVRLIYDTALRVAETAQARSGDFVRRRGKWWLRVLGKGNVYGDVPIPDGLMVDLARYRTFHGLAPTPRADETTPVILSIAGRTEDCLTPTAVYLIVKDVFGQAAEALGAATRSRPPCCAERPPTGCGHTAATHQAESCTDLRNIQKNLRHASIETTSIYLHAEDDARHPDTTGQ
jgi:integrase/recombinase XerC